MYVVFLIIYLESIFYAKCFKLTFLMLPSPTLPLGSLCFILYRAKNCTCVEAWEAARVYLLTCLESTYLMIAFTHLRPVVCKL